MSNSLAGIKVISLEQAVAAPYASGRLARMGATVIKIERPEGDFARRYDSMVNGQSTYFVWLNAGKHSLVLDIKQPEDAERLRQLIAGADVFIQNLAPGAAARAGFDSLALRQAFPQLITCDISGFGEEGPYVDRKAYDLLIQAETGLAQVTGRPEGPGRVGVSVCDIGAGMHALIGILEALYERHRTGQGKGVKVSLFDGMADWMSVPLFQQEYTGQPPSRVGLAHPAIAPYGVFSTRDGGQLLLSIQNEREWRQLCEQVLQRPDWVAHPDYLTNERRVACRATLDPDIQAIFNGYTQTELVARLQAAGIAFGELNSVEALSQHPHLRRVKVHTPQGEVALVASPIRFQNNDGEFEEESIGPVPAVGEGGFEQELRNR